MTRHQVDEPAEPASPPLDELAFRDGGQDYGQMAEKHWFTPLTQREGEASDDVIDLVSLQGEKNLFNIM